MFVKIIFALAFGTAVTPISPPIVNAHCFNAPVVLGTSNIPVGENGRSSSIVNIAAFRNRDSGKTIAWLYKTHSGKLWFHVATKYGREIMDSIGNLHLKRSTFAQIGNSKTFVPIELSSNQSRMLEKDLSGDGHPLTACFTNDLSI